MSQRNYVYELEKFLKEYSHNEELSMLTACQKASMGYRILKKADDFGGDWGDDSDNSSGGDFDDDSDFGSDGKSSGDFEGDWDDDSDADKKSDSGKLNKQWYDSDDDFSEKEIDLPPSFCTSWAYTGSSVALTVLGLLPAWGIPFDIGNGFLNLYCGDYVYAFLSFVSAIPVLGYIGNAIKAIFAGVKGTVKGGPALVKLIVNWWKNSSKVKKLTKLRKEHAELLEKARKLKKQFDKAQPGPVPVTPGSPILPVKMPTGLIDDIGSTGKRFQEVQKEIKQLEKARDKTGAAAMEAATTLKGDWNYFTKSFFEVFNGSGQFSKMLGIPNQKIRNFMRWTKDIFYQVEEQVIGFDYNVRGYRIGD